MSSITTIGVGSAANDGTGDPARTAFQACNTNFSNLNTDKLEATDLEGTAILSTGEAGGSKFLREDGDGTSSWQAIPAPEGTSVLSTGPVTDGYVLTADGAGGAAWEAAAGGGGTPGGSSGDIQYNNAGSFDGSYLKQGTNTIEQYNGTNAQSYYLFNTRTDASNYERGFMRWNSDVLEIGADKAGTGTSRGLRLMSRSAILTFSVNNIDTHQIDGFTFSGTSANSAALENSAPSATTPSLRPNRSDSNTGLGRAAEDQLSLIAGGVEVLRAVEDTGNAIQLATGQTVAGLPTTPAVGMIARVTDALAPSIGNPVVGGGAENALVWYDGAQWVVNGFDSSATGDVTLYNGGYDSTNYERGFMKWNSNVLEIGTEAAGTGTARNLRLISSSAVTEYGGTTTSETHKFYSSSGGAVQIEHWKGGTRNQLLAFNNVGGMLFRHENDISAGNVYTFYSGAGDELTDTDAEQAFMYIEPKINQSGTAGYTGIKLDVTETATGSGTNRLLDLQVASTTKFAVENDGTPVMGTHSAIGAETVTGYITIKDSSGTTRKLAVVS